jgi:hypothetical protein
MRKAYDDLPFLPFIIADAVCQREYKGEEWSEFYRNPKRIAEFEAKRQQMTREQMDEFCRLCDNRCRGAYEAKAPWFEKIVEAKGDGGRDQLYVWITHWLTAYLQNPAILRRDNRAPVGV